MNTKRLLFGSTPLASQAADVGRMLLRVFAGLALAFAHGLGKLPPSEGFISMVGGLGFPGSPFFAWMSGLAEFGGGVLLALGLLTRPAALLIVLNMTTAILLAHAGDPFGDRERALLFGFIALFFLCAGAGRYALDALIRDRRL